MKGVMGVVQEEGSVIGIEAGFFCERGDRKELNEDAILIKTCMLGGVEIGIFLVADGVGGMDSGDVASSITADTLANWWDISFMEILSGKIDIDYILASLDNAICKANDAVINYAHESGKSAGTTLSLLLLLGDLAFVRHIGDSRIYLLCKGQDISRMITEDHSYMAELLKNEQINQEEALNHPQRNAITRCIGSENYPSLYKSYERVRIGDVFVLCTDGFYSLVSENDVSSIIQGGENMTAGEKASALRLLIGKGEAYDNLSLILVSQVRRRTDTL